MQACIGVGVSPSSKIAEQYREVLNNFILIRIFLYAQTQLVLN